MLTHSYLFLTPKHPLSQAGFYMGPWAAVAAFLMISGFSIAHSIESNPKGFYRRRFDRLAPAYYLILLMACGVYARLGGLITVGNGIMESPDLISLVGAVFMLSGFIGPAISVIGQVWSLACEVVYYLAAPLLRKLTTVQIWTLIGLSGAYYLYGGISGHHDYPIVTGLSTPCALLWLWLLGWQIYHARTPHVLAGCAMFAWFLLTANDVLGGRLAALPVIATFGALGYGHLIALPARVETILSWLGDVSYPLYLSHTIPFVLLFAMQQNHPWAANPVIGITAALAVAIVVNAFSAWRIQAGKRHGLMADPRVIRSQSVPSLIAPHGAPSSPSET